MARLVTAKPKLELYQSNWFKYEIDKQYEMFVMFQNSHNALLRLLDMIFMRNNWKVIIWRANSSKTNSEGPIGSFDYPFIYAETEMFYSHWEIIEDMGEYKYVSGETNGINNENSRHSV